MSANEIPRENEKALRSAYEVQGKEVRLPVFVRKASSFSASYAVSARKVRKLLEPTGLQVVEAFPGRAMCTLAALRFEETDLGSYDEFVVAFSVRSRGGRFTIPFVGMALDYYRRRLGMYLHHMAVSNPFVADAGSHIWGFPVSTMDVQLELADGKRICRVHDGEDQVMTFSVRNRPAWSAGAHEMNTYAFSDGAVYRTPWVADPNKVGARNGGAELELGHHPFADELRELGLPKRALMSATVGSFTAKLGVPFKSIPKESSKK